MSWLFQIRREEKKTQREVSEYANITPQMYSLIELGRREPSVRTAKKIARFLNFDWTRFYRHIE